jgi:DNA-binding response OmpR family regulator
VSASTVHPSRLSGVRVLVVEDDTDCREALIEWLTLDGAAAFGAGSGNTGFDAFARERPDVIMSDICMPDGDGFAFIKRVRALAIGEGGLTPAIAMSCLGKREQALMAGFHLFFAKPVDLFKLIDTIADLARVAPPAHAR